MATLNDAGGLDALRAQALAYQGELVESRFRMTQVRIVLLMLRHFCLHFDSEPVFASIREWVEGGMAAAVRWPVCPEFAAWARQHDLRNDRGFVSYDLAV